MSRCLAASLLFLSFSGYAGDWLALPSQPVPESSTKSSITHTETKNVSSAELIQWLGTASQHGIDIPADQWLQLAEDPSRQSVRVVAHNFAASLDRGVLDKRLYQPGWRIADHPALPALENHFDNDNLNLVEPALPEYGPLKKHLQKLRWWMDNALQQFPDKLTLDQGDRHPAVGMLNQWFMDLDLVDHLPVGHYSAEHKKAVKALQRRQGIYADGQMGMRTRQALIALTLMRIKTLLINLERLRWLPRTLPYPRVWVDIAGFKVHWMADRYRQKQYRAIVGIPSRQTPVFQDEIESITINPPWRVPASIASTNILRKAKKDPSFLMREGFMVYSSWKSNAKPINPDQVNWKALSAQSFPYRLEQKPGRVNRLGRFKIDSPNAYSVYLHDTDQPKLFEREVRALSSGCTRVENIDELIQQILASQGLKNQLPALLQAGKTRKLPLRKAVPVYFAYFTAWPQKDGRVRFRDDIYKLDNALMAYF